MNEPKLRDSTPLRESILQLTQRRLSDAHKFARSRLGQAKRNRDGHTKNRYATGNTTFASVDRRRIGSKQKGDRDEVIVHHLHPLTRVECKPLPSVSQGLVIVGEMSARLRVILRGCHVKSLAQRWRCRQQASGISARFA